MPLVSWRTDGLVSTLTLERPEALNAMSEEMAVEFSRAVRLLALERSKVVILQGRGPAFCAGGDLAFIEKNRLRKGSILAPLMRRFYSSFLSIRALPQATLAKIHGPAVGAGLCLALACDLRVVAAEARLGFNFVRLGLNPGMGAWPLARAAFGDARARELLLTGRFFTGKDMLAWGGACAGAAGARALDAVALKLARSVADGSGKSLRFLKSEMSLGGGLAPYLRLEAEGQAEAFKGPDVSEGLSALRDRRLPRFS